MMPHTTACLLFQAPQVAESTARWQKRHHARHGTLTGLEGVLVVAQQRGRQILDLRVARAARLDEGLHIRAAPASSPPQSLQWTSLLIHTVESSWASRPNTLVWSCKVHCHAHTVQKLYRQTTRGKLAQVLPRSARPSERYSGSCKVSTTPSRHANGFSGRTSRWATRPSARRWPRRCAGPGRWLTRCCRRSG